MPICRDDYVVFNCVDNIELCLITCLLLNLYSISRGVVKLVLTQDKVTNKIQFHGKKKIMLTMQDDCLYIHFKFNYEATLQIDFCTGLIKYINIIYPFVA